MPKPRIETNLDVVVRTALGDYAGAVLDGVAAFKGIPYAEPPFGERRLQAPVPVKPHLGVLQCLEYGSTAPKPPYPTPINALLAEPVIAGEGCLNLNVWTPEAAVRAGAERGSGLPVLVWLHGGAFMYGSNAVPTYDGSRFARDGVICVSINYRLGMDGFLLLDGVPANRGLLDQIAALEWVRDNIAAFGGDPARVTVAGESAGAMSVSTLLAMPQAAALFRQAITQSGAAAHVISEPVARRVAAELAGTLGIEPTAEAFAAVGLEQLISAQARFSAALAVNRDPQKWAELALNAMPFEPTVDGEVLPAPPLELIRAGAGSDVRLMTGTNRDEMTMFLVPTGLVEHADAAALEMIAGFYGLTADRVQVYRRIQPQKTPGQLIIDVVTDWFFRVPAIRVAEARSAAVPTYEPTYLYEFGWRTPLWDGRLGATHAAEVAFVFDTLDDLASQALIGNAAPQVVADAVHGAWVSFIATGEPGWPAYDDERTVMCFAPDGVVEATGPVADPRGEVRALWTGIR
ncbi:MAG TPA: carboxylesterase family protein [Kineosporiaceae bacterium]|nr:carboxylesterase family protein [Kineosporiaceae bacterium]